MTEPTRLEVNNKLETLSELTHEEIYVQMELWFKEVSSCPEKLLDDLMSYKIYADKVNAN